MAPARSAKRSKKSKASEASGGETVNHENVPKSPPPGNTKSAASKQALSERNKALEKKLEETTSMYHDNLFLHRHCMCQVLMLTKWIHSTTGGRIGSQKSSRKEDQEVLWDNPEASRGCERRLFPHSEDGTGRRKGTIQGHPGENVFHFEVNCLSWSMTRF